MGWFVPVKGPWHIYWCVRIVVGYVLCFFSCFFTKSKQYSDTMQGRVKIRGNE